MTLAQYIFCGILVTMALTPVAKAIGELDKRAEGSTNVNN